MARRERNSRIAQPSRKRLDPDRVRSGAWNRNAGYVDLDVSNDPEEARTSETERYPFEQLVAARAPKSPADRLREEYRALEQSRREQESCKAAGRRRRRSHDH
jgi:hypothetical protein